MLTIDKLSILRREQLRDILKDFSLQLGPGDKAVLIGEEGNGKSTLLKLIHDPDSVEGYAEWSGSECHCMTGQKQASCVARR